MAPTPTPAPSSTPSPSPSPSAAAPAAPAAASAPNPNPANPNPAPAADPAAPAPAAAPQRPGYVLETEWDATTGKIKDDVFGKRVNDLSAFKAEQDVRKQAIPPSPDKYEVKLPEGFKPPEGMQFEFDMEAPELKAAREVAHKRGIDQETFSELLSVFAGNKIAELQQTNTARTAEMAKLGAAAPARIEAVETWFKAKVGGKAGPMMAALKAYPVAETVEALEGVIRAFSAQGGTDFNQTGRETQAEAGAIPGYDQMTFAQRRMAQMNQKAAGGGK